MLAALSAHEALLHSAASLQGFHPSVGWGRRSPISRHTRHPGSLELRLPGAFPFPALGLYGFLTLPYRRTSKKPADRPGAFRHQATASAACLSFRALQERTRAGYCSLCFKVSKSWEVGLPFPRLPAP